MYYCERCHHLSKKEVCCYCHHQKLRIVRDDDLCFLIERQMIWAEMLKERFDKHHIFYECCVEKGAALALKVGPVLENYHFYVPYSQYCQAKEVVDEMFCQS